MIKKYVTDQWSRALHVLRIPSYKAPGHSAAGMISKPNQSVQQAPRAPQYPQNNGPQVALFQRLHHQDTVKQIPVKQNEYILRAPSVPIGPKRTDIPIDRRLGIPAIPFEGGYPIPDARYTFPRGGYEAPPSQQSIPGYVLVNGALYTNKGYPKGALRAPKPRTGGGQCNDG